MFKKTLLAAALATTTFGAVASTVTITPASMGVEFAVGTQATNAHMATITLGREYATGNIITLTIAGASLLATAGTPAVPVALTIGGTAADNVDFLDYSGDSVRLLVTGDVDEDSTLTIAGIKLNISSAANNGKVTLVAAGRVDTVDGAIDVDSSAATTYITFATEYVSSVLTQFDAVVDVNAARQKFTGGTTSDELVISNTRVAPAGGTTTASTVTYTVFGDFTFLDADSDGKLGGSTDGSITADDGGVVAIATDFLSASITDSTGASFAATGTVGIQVNTPADVVIPDQSFTTSVDVKYTYDGAPAAGVTKSTLTSATAGSWTLNGAKAHIPFLPFGTDFSQSVTVSNTSTQVGGVDLVIYKGGSVFEVKVLLLLLVKV